MYFQPTSAPFFIKQGLSGPVSPVYFFPSTLISVIICAFESLVKPRIPACLSAVPKSTAEAPVSMQKLENNKSPTGQTANHTPKIKQYGIPHNNWGAVHKSLFRQFFGFSVF
jgi:hypothetical protein